MTTTAAQPKEALKTWKVKLPNGKWTTVKGILLNGKVYCSGGQTYTSYEAVS